MTMAVNVSATVTTGSVDVSAQIQTRSVNTSATVSSNNAQISANVNTLTPANVSASVHRNNVNLGAYVNPHVIQQNDHSQLQNLDYENAGHTGFQRELIPDESITIDEEGHIHANGESYTAGQNISIDENNVISAVDTTYTQGDGITIDQYNVISNDIYPLVPAQATQTNQLADKDFVNSSIATSTATFRGTVTSVDDTEVEAQVALSSITGMDDNDYAFVKVENTPQTGVDKFKRYKYNGTIWEYEYTLNNSSFTSAQWYAINSGITDTKVTQYDDYATSKQDVLTAGSHITINNNVISANITPVFLGKYNLVDDLGLSIGATESQIATALATQITTAVEYDYCLVEIPDYQVYNGYSAFASVDDYVDYYVIYNSAYELVTNANKSSLGIVPKTTVAYILNNVYSVVRYNFDGTDWTSDDNNGYANVDASNFTDSGTTFLSGLGMPSNRYETLTLGASGSTYTAPANGFYHFTRNARNSGEYAVILNDNNLSDGDSAISGGNYVRLYVLVKAGDTISIVYNLAGNVMSQLLFIYAEGNPTPPQP